METSRRGFMTAAGAVAAGLGGPALAQTTKGLRLVSFTRRDDKTLKVRCGAMRGDDRIVDFADAAAREKTQLAFDPGDMISLAASGEKGLAQARLLAEKGAPTFALADVTLLSPIPKPARNIYAVGWNYLEHFKEGQAVRKTDQTYPEHPVFFTKGSHTMNAPFGDIPFDEKVSTMIDWEGELAVVIGKRGRNIAEADAMKHVFGYAVINDTTARDLQQKKHGGQWFKGKSLDGHGPMGPWIVPADALDPDKLHLVTRVNGVVKQDAMTTQMYFKIPRIIAELSLGLTLEPGDVIATGTPPGVGVARNPPEFMKPGDVMETEIEGIGVIRNKIAAV
ncbi:MAG: fumarylacetoacetate hydrolase family protein [Hyphomicrobiales bacterium]|nr:fumarylacetoacetate hydrolase family protein [Hyphomicrobiales bacterium]